MKPAGAMRGFTLIELIMVIVILGVLAVFAAPRLTTSEFAARSFHDETLALLRYAQKTAVAQRRTVCVALSAGAPASAKLSIASLENVSTCNTSLVGPNKNCSGGPTGSQGCIAASSGVSYSAAPVTINFNGLGQPTASSYAVQVASGGANISPSITIETNTGYVHD